MTAKKLKKQRYSSQSVTNSKVASSTILVPSPRKRVVESQEDLLNLEFVDDQRLSSHLIDLIDVLTELQKDWICLLHSDWEVDLSTFNLVSANASSAFIKSSIQRIGEMVPSIHQAQYQPMLIAQQMHWIYTCCLQIKGLGRVRVVLDFDNSRFTDSPIIFATNRLDWSSRRVLTQWFQRRPPTHVDGREKLEGLCVEAFCQG